MKKVIVILVIVVILFILILGGVVGILILRQKKKDEPIQSIHHFYFHYSVGYAYLANVNYEINIEDEKYIASIKLVGVEEDDATKVELSDEDLQKFMDILNKYHIGRWDGFQKSDKMVLDGDSFSLGLRTLENREVYASGYESYPKNYGSVKGELDAYFQALTE